MQGRARVAVAALALATAPAGAGESAFDGWYLGAQAGYSQFQFDVRGFGPHLGGLADEYEADGLTGGLFLGYGRSFRRGYLGLEGEYGLSDAEYTETGAEFRQTLEVDDTWGLGLRAGYLLSEDLLLYGRAGWQRSGFELTEQDPGGTFVFDDDLDAFRVGLGLERALRSGLRLRFDYSYSDYDSRAYDFGGGDVQASEPEEHLFRLGVGYQF